jgi:hypothetical protein
LLHGTIHTVCSLGLPSPARACPRHTSPYEPRLFAQILTRLIGAAERSAFDVALLDTFARASYLELDYEAEAANQRRFEAELVPRMGGKVYVPKVILATRKVLATEWIQGEQLARCVAGGRGGRVYMPKCLLGMRKGLATKWIEGEQLAPRVVGGWGAACGGGGWRESQHAAALPCEGSE